VEEGRDEKEGNKEKERGGISKAVYRSHVEWRLEGKAT
jgi:hypothetical protein